MCVCFVLFIFFLYSHQARCSNDEGAPARNIKPVNNAWSSYFHAADEKSVRASGPHGEPKKRKKGGKRSEVQKQVGETLEKRFMCSLCPSLPVFTAAVEGASLPLDQVSGGPHRCAAVSSAVINIRTNPDSPESSQ